VLEDLKNRKSESYMKDVRQGVRTKAVRLVICQLCKYEYSR
jgi:hypothetical protein